MVTIGLYQATWTVISLNISVFQEIFTDRDMDAKQEEHNLKDNEANKENFENNETDDTFEEVLSGGENEKDDNFSSKDEDSDVTVRIYC